MTRERTRLYIYTYIYTGEYVYSKVVCALNALKVFAGMDLRACEVFAQLDLTTWSTPMIRSISITTTDADSGEYPFKIVIRDPFIGRRVNNIDPRRRPLRRVNFFFGYCLAEKVIKDFDFNFKFYRTMQRMKERISKINISIHFFSQNKNIY